jgi:hypothetical protein
MGLNNPENNNDGEKENNSMEVVEEKKPEEGMAALNDEAEKPEEERGDFSLESYMDIPAVIVILKEELEGGEELPEEYREEISMAVSELENKEGVQNFGLIVKGMYGRMCKMAQKLKDGAEREKAMMAENSGLKAFKMAVEEEKKNMAVEQTLAELNEKVVVSETDMFEMKEKAKEFSGDDLEGWKNYCKARAFEFAVRPTKIVDGTVRIGLPFSEGVVKSGDIWAGTKN